MFVRSSPRERYGRAQLVRDVRDHLPAQQVGGRQVVGHAPGELAPPPPLPPFPASADQAVQIALAGNPDLLAITRQGDAAGYDVRTARASRLPTVSAVASGDYANTLGGNTIGPQSGTATSG